MPPKTKAEVEKSKRKIEDGACLVVPRGAVGGRVAGCTNPPLPRTRLAATFGLKNKNKSKKVQAYVASVKSQEHKNAADRALAGKTPEQIAAEKVRRGVRGCLPRAVGGMRRRA